MNQAVLVDDEPYVVENLKNAIDWNGFQMEIGLASTSSTAALDYILSNPVSLVITDISMPDMDGLELIRKIKDAKPYIYVVVLSAYNNFEYARTALKYGAENYLLKPVDPDELSDAISQIAGHIQEREQLNSTYGQAILTFRSAFTEQWVKNLLPANEINTKANLLGINLNAARFTAVVFSCSKSSPDNMSKFFDLFLPCLPGQYIGSFFFETPTCLVGVLSPAESCTEEIPVFIRRIIHDAASAGIQIFACVGPSVSHCMDVHQSYTKASSHIWLEYTQASCYFCKEHSALEDAASAALLAYDQSFGEEEEPVRQLYKRFPACASACTVLLVTIRIRQICRDSYKLFSEYPELCTLLADFPLKSQEVPGYIRYALHFLNRSGNLLSKINQSMYPCVDAVLKSVQDLDDKDISLKTLAARLNVTPSYLGTIFRRQTGYYFNDYLAEVRLKKAAQLLAETDMKIKDIIEKTGFSSQPYFTRSFKRFYNMSPASYRKAPVSPLWIRSLLAVSTRIHSTRCLRCGRNPGRTIYTLDCSCAASQRY